MRKIYWYISSYIRRHGWVFLASIIGTIVFFSLVLPHWHPMDGGFSSHPIPIHSKQIRMALVKTTAASPLTTPKVSSANPIPNMATGMTLP